MERDTAGLDLVNHIRNDLGNRDMRIVLRTGQPGVAPERDVIRDFEINEYMNKTHATADKLYSCTLAALRAYDDIITLKRSRQQLERYRDGLELVIEASANLFEQRSLRIFARGLLHQLSALLMPIRQTMVVRASHADGSSGANGVTVVQTATGFEVLARAGRFDQGDVNASPEAESELSPEVVQSLNECMTAKRTLVQGNVFVGYFPTKRGITNLIYLDGVAGADALDFKLIDVFSKNISIAFENLYLDREIADTQIDIIATLGDVVETRSGDTANHVKRVAHLASMLGEAMGLSEDDCQLLYMASPMHDIGKVAIPDSILLKKGGLDAEEWAHMKRHAEIGQNIFARSSRPLFQAAAVIAGQHHEKYDGTGYPNGLKGESIHIFARIVALVDVFDALVNKRSYKESWPMEQVVVFIQAGSGSHFDPVLVDFLINNLDWAKRQMAKFPDGQAVDSESTRPVSPMSTQRHDSPR
jgi:HD-GYP domain-containing protein (c-di-GMP phosphodiesterase class II)